MYLRLPLYVILSHAANILTKISRILENYHKLSLTNTKFSKRVFDHSTTPGSVLSKLPRFDWSRWPSRPIIWLRSRSFALRRPGGRVLSHLVLAKNWPPSTSASDLVTKIRHAPIWNYSSRLATCLSRRLLWDKAFQHWLSVGPRQGQRRTKLRRRWDKVRVKIIE